MTLHLAWQLGLVGLGGSLGAMLRFLTTKSLLELWPDYAGIGTLAVNVLGSFAIGVVMARTSLADDWRIFLVTGVLGGFTTFSALTYESKTMWPQSIGMSSGHLAANVILGLLAVIAGEAVCRWAAS